MTRKVLLALIVAAAAATAAPAQNWAEKMFPDGLDHDFGVVPHGAQLFHRFTITNIYAVRMEITSITPGCGCVTATASKRVLDPQRDDHARRQHGRPPLHRPQGGHRPRRRSALTFTSSADVKVSAVSRADVVFNPGDVEFGAVDHGQATFADRRSGVRRPARLADRRGRGGQGPAVRGGPDGILSKAGQGGLPDQGDAQGRRRARPDPRDPLSQDERPDQSDAADAGDGRGAGASCRCRRPS